MFFKSWTSCSRDSMRLCISWMTWKISSAALAELGPFIPALAAFMLPLLQGLTICQVSCPSHCWLELQCWQVHVAALLPFKAGCQDELAPALLALCGSHSTKSRASPPYVALLPLKASCQDVTAAALLAYGGSHPIQAPASPADAAPFPLPACCHDEAVPALIALDEPHSTNSPDSPAGVGTGAHVHG